jgi:hypothetical protein
MFKFPQPRHHSLLILQTFFNARIRALSFSVLLTALSLLKPWLDSSLRIAAQTSQNYDDALYVRLSYDISNGDWLGPCNSLTLIKYLLYPLWLAFNYKTGLPLLLTQSFFKILAGLLLVYQLRQYRINSVFLLATFLLCLFNPFIETRVMREGIYSGLAALVFVSFFSNKLWHVLWSVLLGFSLGFFWLTREEGVWFVPSISQLFDVCS